MKRPHLSHRLAIAITVTTIALAAAIIIGSLANGSGSPTTPATVTVLVTRHSVAAGSVLTTDDVTERRLPPAPALVELVTRDDIADGVHTTRALRANEAVTRASIQPTGTPAATSASEPTPAETSRTVALTSTIAAVVGLSGCATVLLLRRRRRQRRRDATAGTAPPIRSGLQRSPARGPFTGWARQQIDLLVDDLDPRQVTGAPVAIELSEATGIEVLWSTPQRAPTVGGWRAVDGGWAWRLDHDPTAAPPARPLATGIPGLVTIGHRDGRQLLIDLETTGTLTVTGPAEHTTAFLRSIATEITVGDSLADASVNLVERELDRDIKDSAGGAASIPAGGGAHAGRDAGRQPGRPTGGHRFRARVAGNRNPLKVTVTIDRHHAACVQARTSPHRIAAVIASDELANSHPTAWVELADDGRTARLEPIGIDFTPVALPTTPAESTEGRSSTDLDPARTDTPASAGTTTPARGSIDGPLLRLFDPDHGSSVEHDRRQQAAHDRWRPDLDVGPVETEPAEPTIAVAGEPPASWPKPELIVQVLGVPSIPSRPGIGRRELILTVLLACRGGTLAASAAQDALWSGKPVEPKTVWNLVTSTRRALGDLDDGSPVMPAADRARGTLRLDPRVTTDLQVLRRDLEVASELCSTRAIAVLGEALDRIEGPPFDADGYDWAHRDQDVTDAARVIVQGVNQLVELALDAGQHDLARHGISRGLRALPGDEHLYRLRMRLEAHAGNATGVIAAHDELCRHLTDLDTSPSSATTALYNELRMHGASSNVT